ncbi:MAG: ParB/RepB/Spo0J family partition protein [Paracoccaceae bacterium]
MKKKKVLGRGLSSFISDDDFLTNSENIKRNDQIYIPLEYIKPNPNQPRKYFDSEELKELADTISDKGILQPLLVIKNGENDYIIVAGERRWRAAQIAQIHEIPVIVKKLTNEEIIEIAIIENVQRSELKPLEEADGYFRLVQEFGYSHEKISNLVGKSRPYVSNLIRLLSLPVEVKNLIKTGDLTSGHARTLLNCNDPISLSHLIVKKSLSVRQTELLTKRKKLDTVDKKSFSINKELDTKELEDTLTAHLKFKVKILSDKKKKSGRLNILFKDNNELQKICNILKTQF